MKYKEVLNLINNNYQVLEKANNFSEILVNKMLNNFNYYFIGLTEKNGEAYLSDMANTTKTISVNEQDLHQICLKNNIEVFNGELNCKFNSITSLNNLINCITQIVNLNN